MKRLLYGLGALAVLGGFFVWWFSPTQMVKRRVGNLLRIISFEDGQGLAARQTGVYALHSLIAREVELSSDTHPQANGLFEREQIESAFNWLAGQVEESSFELVELKRIRFREPFAEVEIVVEGAMKLKNSSSVDGTYAVFLVWENQENHWLLNHAEWSKVASK